jgi:hypothetical protein
VQFKHFINYSSSYLKIEFRKNIYKSNNTSMTDKIILLFVPLFQNKNFGEQLTSGLSSSSIMMMMFWIMATGAGIWVLDNVLKRFENVMEDGFKHQARSLNKSLRINMAIVVISLSLIAYLKFSDIDTSDLLNSGVMGSVLWVFSAVGKFLLHLFTYLVYWAHLAWSSSYDMPKPVADEDVILGFVIFLGYILVKRLLIKRVNPLVWVMIVVLITAGGSYVAKTTGVNPSDVIKNTIRNIRGTDTTKQVAQDDENTKLKPNPIDENDRTADNFTTHIPDSIMFPIIEEFIDAVDIFVEEESSLKPKEEDYSDDFPRYQQAITDHMQSMRSRDSFKEIVRLTNSYKVDKRGLFKDKAFQTVLQELLCDYHSVYFERICPDDDLEEQPMAN